MQRYSLNEFIGGWFLGNFEPSLVRNSHFEVCLKRYSKGETEPRHFQRVSTEITVVVQGSCRIGGETLTIDDILIIPPGEVADFEALEDVVLIAVKTPSIPEDKILEGN